MIQSYRGVRPQIHPTAWVHPMATVIGDVALGPEVSVWPGAVLRGDCGPIRVGAQTNLQDGCVCHTTVGVSAVQIGARVTVGHGAILHGCVIGDDCLIGMGSIVLDNAVVATGSFVAAGSLLPVGKAFEPGLIAGNPAAWKRATDERLSRMIADGWRNYLQFMAAFRDGGVETLG